MNTIKLNFEKMCRLCMKVDNIQLDVFNEKYTENCTTLVDRIYKVSSIKIISDDTLPTTICYVCKNKIEELYSFQAEVEKTEMIFQECLTYAQNNQFYTSDEGDEDFESKNCMKLVSTEEDGTEVYTLNDEIDSLSDSIEVVPVQKNNIYNKHNKIVPGKNDVIVYRKHSHNIDAGVPLKYITSAQELNKVNNTNNFNDKNSDEINAKENKKLLSNGNTKITTNQILSKGRYSPQKHATEILVQEMIPENESESNQDSSKLISRKLNFHNKDKTCDLSCQLCLQKFINYDELKQHISHHFDGFNVSEVITDDSNELEEKQNEICVYCNEKVLISELDLHLSSEHSNKLYVCKKCSQSFSEKQELEEHIKTLHSQFQCNLCSNLFSHYLDFQSHFSSVHSKSPFWCPSCSKTFLQKYDFIIHQRRHLNIRPFKCKRCSKFFVTATLCKEHERRHAKETVFLCKSCGKGFVRLSELKFHEKNSHVPDQPLVCSYCQKVFVNSASFKLHIKRHQLGLRFACNVCGKAFYLNSELQRHEQIHSGKRKYPCSYCENSFMSQPELNRHLKYHKGEKRFKCNLCDKRYFESGHLRIHERSHTGVKPYECQICFKKFVARIKLVRHLKIHDQNRVSTTQGSIEFLENKTKNSTELLPHIDNITFLTNDKLNNLSENVILTEDHSEKIICQNLTKMLTNVDDNQVLGVENVIIDETGNVLEMQIPDGQIIVMENTEPTNSQNDLIYSSIQDNIKIEIIDT